MDLELQVLDDEDALAVRAATFVAASAREAVSAHARFWFAVSGGRTPWAMFAAMRPIDLPWPSIEIYQVDERIAPRGDAVRNLTHLEASLPAAAVIHPMPVEDDDLDAAAARYASELPERFDLIHLGLGPDGHTASLVPGDPVLEVTDRMVATTRTYIGERRMTLTYPALERAMNLMWLIEGADKAPALERLLVGDTSIPAGRIRARHQIVFADRAAAADHIC